MSWSNDIPRPQPDPAHKPRPLVPADRHAEAAGCDICGGSGVMTTAPEGGRWASAERCTCTPECATCRGSGLRHVRVEGSRRGAMGHCHCRPAMARRAAYIAARVPIRYAAARLHDLRPEYAGGIRRVIDAGRSLTSCGGIGRGKTHTLAAIAEEVTLGRGLTCRYVDLTELIAELKAQMRPDAPETVTVAGLCDADVLLIDEVGRGRDTGYEQSVIDELVSRRYNYRRPVFIASNLDIAGFDQLVGERTASRLREMGRVMLASGDDERRKRQD